jgi:hypothetical protein
VTAIKGCPLLSAGELLREDPDRYYRKAIIHGSHGRGPLAACWRCWPRLIPARLKWALTR